MRRQFKFGLWMWLALVMFSASARLQAQGFGLSVTSSSTSVLVSNAVTFTINVTNLNLGNELPNAVVTNIMPRSTSYYSAASSQGTATNYGNVVVFNLGTFAYTAVAQMTVTAYPASAGFATNTVLVSSPLYTTNTASTNIVIEVTNVPPILADLGVAISSPAQPVITNDLTGYELFVTNAGPAAATGITLTNTLPSGVNFQNASRAFTRSGSNLIFSLGSLANGSDTNVQISIQPTNAAVLPLMASVGASGTVDTNTANNSVTNSLNVTNYLAGTLVAVTNSAQSLNLQNGLTEQSILLSNNGTSDVPAVRVVVAGLTNRLFNALGTNGVSPFVVYGTDLSPGKSVNLLLQYYPRGNFSFTNGQLQAFAVPAPDWTPPPPASFSTNINISRIVPLPNGRMMIEFPAVTNRSYTVVYSDNVAFSNAMIAPPSIVAPANRVQWMDYGPPTTLSAPTNSATRFYRVFQNP